MSKPLIILDRDGVINHDSDNYIKSALEWKAINGSLNAISKLKKIGWKGLYIGDLGNPRGGPTPYGHVSHQVGLEVDIKMKPPGKLQLSLEESSPKKYDKPRSNSKRKDVRRNKPKPPTLRN